MGEILWLIEEISTFQETHLFRGIDWFFYRSVGKLECLDSLSYFLTNNSFLIVCRTNST